MLGKNNIFLIGPMGSGKTAVGKQLARLQQLQFIDSDAEIERRTGVDINLIFEKEGEAGFRARECTVLDELTQLDGIVLSTGGGAVLLEANRRVLAERGVVAYLETSVSQQTARVNRGGQNRPLLANTNNPAARLAELMKDRQPLYQQTADITVRTDGRRVAVVAEDIVRQLRQPSENA